MTNQNSANQLMDIALRIRDMRDILGYSIQKMAELTEISLHARAFHPQDDLEAATIRDMEYVRLHAAISSLPEIQRRRLWLHFFEEFTYEEIAVMEGCTKRAVKFSVDLALQKLKEKI